MELDGVWSVCTSSAFPLRHQPTVHSTTGRYASCYGIIVTVSPG